MNITVTNSYLYCRSQTVVATPDQFIDNTVNASTAQPVSSPASVSIASTSIVSGTPEMTSGTPSPKRLEDMANFLHTAALAWVNTTDTDHSIWSVLHCRPSHWQQNQTYSMPVWGHGITRLFSVCFVNVGSLYANICCTNLLLINDDHHFSNGCTFYRCPKPQHYTDVITTLCREYPNLCDHADLRRKKVTDLICERMHYVNSLLLFSSHDSTIE